MPHLLININVSFVRTTGQEIRIMERVAVQLHLSDLREGGPVVTKV